jgi:hypothetical protein
VASRKGSPNKVGAQVKDNILAVFTRLGSTAAMAEWAKEHRTEFYKMYASLAPKEIDATVTHRDETTLTDDELADIATGRSTGTAETPSGETIDSSVH